MTYKTNLFSKISMAVTMSLIVILGGATVFAADEDSNANSGETGNESAANKDDTMQPSQARHEPNPRSEIEQDIAKALSDSLTQVIKLTALEQEFDAYYMEADVAEPIGSILFFPDDRTHSDWPVTLNPLRTHLTKYKWQTLVITQPAAQLKPIPERSPPESAENTTDNSPTEEAVQTPPANAEPTPAPTAQPETTEETTEDAAKPLSETVLARAVVAHEMLKQKSDLLIITGIGQGATWAAAYAATMTEQDQENVRLFLINPQQSEDVSAPSLLESIMSLKVDTFDLYSVDNPSQSNWPRQRKRAANRSDVISYQQIKAPGFSWQQQGNSWLSKKVRGILKNQVENQLEEKQNKTEKPEKMLDQKPGMQSNANA